MSLCKEYLRENKFTLGFVRWDSVDKTFLDVLFQMKKSCSKVLMDFHGYFDGLKASNLKGIYTVYTTKKNGEKLSLYVDYGLTETKNSKLFGIEVMPIDTGIDVSKYKPHAYKGDGNKLSMISVANERSYHGYDRIINGIEGYYKSPRKTIVELHLVGMMSESTKKLIRKCGVENYVFLYGYQTGAALNKIYSLCNMGIGPLAPHRVGGKEGTGTIPTSRSEYSCLLVLLHARDLPRNAIINTRFG